jgi:DNA-binding protein HU-beta
MNKTELVKAIAEATGLTQTLATDALDAFMESVTTALKAGDKVTLVGFGTFSVAERAARTGRNPKTGEELKIAASKAPKFSAGANLKAAVIPPVKGKKAK